MVSVCGSLTTEQETIDNDQSNEISFWVFGWMGNDLVCRSAELFEAELISEWNRRVKKASLSSGLEHTTPAIDREKDGIESRTKHRRWKNTPNRIEPYWNQICRMRLDAQTHTHVKIVRVFLRRSMKSIYIRCLLLYNIIRRPVTILSKRHQLHLYHVGCRSLVTRISYMMIRLSRHTEFNANAANDKSFKRFEQLLPF